MKSLRLKKKVVTFAMLLMMLQLSVVPVYAAEENETTEVLEQQESEAEETGNTGLDIVQPDVNQNTEVESDTYKPADTDEMFEVSTDTDALVQASQIACNYTLTGNTANYTCDMTPVQMHGKLSVSGTNIVDESGNIVQLRGVSLHGIQHEFWDSGQVTRFKDYVNLSAFQILRDEWGVNLIRIPVYTAENGYCQGKAASMDETIQNAVNYATQLGMYVIIDWHILSDGNPQTYQSQADAFFRKYAGKYAGYNNVIYEICNEPNNVGWSTVKSFAVSIIRTIRSVNPSALIVVGTPDWSQIPSYGDRNVASNPIWQSEINGSGSGLATNVLYSIHFYAATHRDNIQANVTNAHNKGLPIFCTEFSICDATGNGSYDFDNASKWMSLLNSYNISFCMWNLSNNKESSAMFVTNCKKLNGWVNADLSTAGAWFINMVRPKYEAELANITPNVYNGVDYSAIYDYDYYSTKYSDIKAVFGSNKRAALQHFLTFGINEGRQGNAEFNVQYYRNRYVDLRSTFGYDLRSYYTHYVYCGKNEKRDAKTPCTLTGYVTSLNGVDYRAVYNYQYYMSKYSDVKKAYDGDDIAALQHFVLFGMNEGRQGNAEFNVKYYKNRYGDLRMAYKKDSKSYYLHYMCFGVNEGRDGETPCELVNYVTCLNGVDYSAVYNYTYYLNKYDDLKNAFEGDDVSALQHFVLFGMKEGRQASDNFNVTEYKNRYADLRNAFGADLRNYYFHYINYGKNEGRKAN